MIDNNTVQKIIDTAEIVDVVNDFVSLKKRGVNYIGLCPFHNEKTPSFIVSPAKGIYKCFGCGNAGNSVRFIMEHEKLSYPESLKHLAKKYNIEVFEKEQTTEEKEKRSEQDSLYIVSAYAQKYFTKILHENNEGKAIGLSYFYERGFRLDIIKKFELGYSLEKRDAFAKHAQKSSYKLDYLEKSGLVIKGNNNLFDRFSGRVIFPIHSISGKVIGFGARTLKSDKKIAKYLNSPESQIYHKSNILYGYYFAKQQIIKTDKCYLVEGYTDVISLYQSGIENVVASSGTSLTLNQIRLINRFTKNLTIIFDGDEAGIKASLRGIDMVLKEGLNVKVLSLPTGEDPDSFSKSLNYDALIKYFNNNELDFIKFKTKLLQEEAKNDPIKSSTLISDIVKSISYIPDNITRSVYIKECSTLLNIKEEVLYNTLNSFRKKNLTNEYKKVKRNERNQSKTTSAPLPAFIDDVYSKNEEHEIIYFLLNFGNEILYPANETKNNDIAVAQYIIDEIQNEDLKFKNLIYKKIFEDYKYHITNNINIDEKYFTNHINKSICTLSASLLSKNYKPSKIWETGGIIVETPEKSYKTDVPKCIITYKLKIIQMALRHIIQQVKEVQNNDENIISELQNKIKVLNEKKILLAKESGQRTILYM